MRANPQALGQAVGITGDDLQTRLNMLGRNNSAPAGLHQAPAESAQATLNQQNLRAHTAVNALPMQSMVDPTGGGQGIRGIPVKPEQPVIHPQSSRTRCSPTDWNTQLLSWMLQ